MTNRKILYGYQIHDGALAIVPEEQQVVRMVFTLYNAGASYNPRDHPPVPGAQMPRAGRLCSLRGGHPTEQRHQPRT